MTYTGPYGVQYPGDGEDDTDTADSGDSTSTDSFDTSTDTLGTTSLGTSTGSDDQEEEYVVEDTSDPDDSSPAGGAGQTSATSRFTGIDGGTVSEMSEEEQLATTQEASDVLNDAVSNTELDPTEAQNVPTARENLNDQSEPNQSEGGLNTEVQTDENDGMGTGTVVVAGAVLAVLLSGGG